MHSNRVHARDYSFNYGINEHSPSSPVTPVNMQHNHRVNAPLYSHHDVQFGGGLQNAHQTSNNFQYSSNMHSKVNEQFVCNHEIVLSSVVNNCMQRNVTSNFERVHHSMNANVSKVNDHPYFNGKQIISDEEPDYESISYMMKDFPTEDCDMNIYI